MVGLVSVRPYRRSGRRVSGYERKQLVHRGRRGKVVLERSRGVKFLKSKSGLFVGSRPVRRGERGSRLVRRESRMGRLVGRS